LGDKGVEQTHTCSCPDIYNYLSNPYWCFPVTHALARRHRYDAPPKKKDEVRLNFILRPRRRAIFQTGFKGEGVDVSIRHLTPPPLFGVGGGGERFTRGSNFLCSVFFCDNMLFSEFEKKRKKTVATYPIDR
jgi:hypothetical protein